MSHYDRARFCESRPDEGCKQRIHDFLILLFENRDIRSFIDTRNVSIKQLSEAISIITLVRLPVAAYRFRPDDPKPLSVGATIFLKNNLPLFKRFVGLLSSMDADLPSAIKYEKIRMSLETPGWWPDSRSAVEFDSISILPPSYLGSLGKSILGKSSIEFVDSVPYEIGDGDPDTDDALSRIIVSEFGDFISRGEDMKRFGIIHDASLLPYSVMQIEKALRCQEARLIALARLDPPAFDQENRASLQRFGVNVLDAVQGSLIILSSWKYIDEEDKEAVRDFNRSKDVERYRYLYEKYVQHD